MPAIEPIPDQILAVFLGAGWYAHAPMLAQRGPSFENSASDLRQYLLGLKGKHFLKRRIQELRAAGKSATDLILYYYVGHGMSCGPDRAYHLAIRSTEAAREGLTRIGVSDLAQTMNDHGSFLRKFRILDACFAGSAQREFQSSGLRAHDTESFACQPRSSLTQIFNEMPAGGKAVPCAASATEAAADGGAFACICRNLRAASRDRGAPGYTNNRWGFRIAGSLFQILSRHLTHEY